MGNDEEILPSTYLQGEELTAFSTELASAGNSDACLPHRLPERWFQRLAMESHDFLEQLHDHKDPPVPPSFLWVILNNAFDIKPTAEELDMSVNELLRMAVHYAIAIQQEIGAQLNLIEYERPATLEEIFSPNAEIRGRSLIS